MYSGADVNEFPVVGSLALAASALVVMGVRRRGRNLLFYIAALLTFFGAAPVLNILLGSPVYVGTVAERVPQASFGIALAVWAMVAVDTVLPQRVREPGLRSLVYRHPFLPAVLSALALATCLILVVFGQGLLEASTKGERLAHIGPIHYWYLLIQLYAMSLFFTTRSSRTLRRAYFANAVAYVVYCLVTNERDFIFVIFAVFAHRLLLNPQLAPLRNLRQQAVARVRQLGPLTLAVVALGALGLATFLFASRSAAVVDRALVLNQGSLLFIDTYVMDKVPDERPYEWGATYLRSVTPTRQSLADDFAREYAPAGDSGYGYSITAEAYLNFGMMGIPIVVFLVSFGHRILINRLKSSDWTMYFSVVYFTAWMYGLRGDSVQFIRTLVYGAAFFFILCRALAVRRTLNAPRVQFEIPSQRSSNGSQQQLATSG